MKKVYLLAAVAATMLAACSSHDSLDSGQPDIQSPATADAELAVGFDAYTYRSTTRAGLTGDIDNTALRADAFGVFGYYTDNRDYDQLAMPNFFWNQKVEYSGSVWTYEPVKYWPNEYGDNAISDDNDKVSFFAYAPYVEVNAAGKFVENATAIATAEAAVTTAQTTYDGDPTAANLTALNAAKADLGKLKGNVGITGMTRNTASGVPSSSMLARSRPVRRSICCGDPIMRRAGLW